MSGSRIALIFIVFIILVMLGWYWYSSPNNDINDDVILENNITDKTSELSNNNSIINNNDDLLNVADPENSISITPTSMGFSYNHNNPICPSPIGTVQFSGAPPDSNWQVDFNDQKQPIWFDVPGGLSGPIDEPPVFEFPCLLDIYDTQSQFLDVTVEVFDKNDTLLDTQIINVSGYFEFGNNPTD